ncbi:RNA helicase aquarius-like [Papaver somniferum]|uniref:RNA helicase aquarius-like n=1 Tax=Papaver somniferum TaxID=3469 RepID=UPI000E6F9D70|nr:RNA helicase aquarius-like [Papaver somniferum]
MPEVHGSGTHSYKFKRQRIGEYPAAIAESSPEKKPVSTVSSSITLDDIQRDKLTEMASTNWSRTTTTDKMKPYNPDLVKEIYESELSVKQGHNKIVSLQRVSILEVSRYLEYYLCPNFDPDSASFEHVMSMILMINEKFRENVAAWVCFSDNKDLFKAFLERVLRLKEQARTLRIAEKTNYLRFMINLFQSLEDDIVSQKVLMKLASLQVWSCLSYGRFQVVSLLKFQLAGICL